jgi:hypothetical protein
MRHSRLLLSSALGFVLLAGSPLDAQAQDKVSATQRPIGAGMIQSDAIAFANRLIARMTIDEKIGQISQRFDVASLFPSGQRVRRACRR